MSNFLLNDFEDIKTLTYSKYVDIKGVQYLSLNNLKDLKIKKSFDTLQIEDKFFQIESKSINEVVDLLLIEIPDLDISVYQEHPEHYLKTSAMFLADFDTHLAVKYNVSSPRLSLKIIENYKDVNNNKYILKDLKVFSEYNEELPYYKTETSIRIPSSDHFFTVVCFYEASDLKLNYMQEYPLTSINHLSSMSSEI